MEFWSSSRHLYLVSGLSQNIRDLFALLALNLDHPVFHRPARAAFLFKFLCHPANQSFYVASLIISAFG